MGCKIESVRCGNPGLKDATPLMVEDDTVCLRSIRVNHTLFRGHCFQVEYGTRYLAGVWRSHCPWDRLSGEFHAKQFEPASEILRGGYRFVGAFRCLGLSGLDRAVTDRGHLRDE